MLNFIIYLSAFLYLIFFPFTSFSTDEEPSPKRGSLTRRDSAMSHSSDGGNDDSDDVKDPDRKRKTPPAKPQADKSRRKSTITPPSWQKGISSFLTPKPLPQAKNTSPVMITSSPEEPDNPLHQRNAAPAMAALSPLSQDDPTLLRNRPGAKDAFVALMSNHTPKNSANVQDKENAPLSTSTSVPPQTPTAGFIKASSLPLTHNEVSRDWYPGQSGGLVLAFANRTFEQGAYATVMPVPSGHVLYFGKMTDEEKTTTRRNPYATSRDAQLAAEKKAKENGWKIKPHK
jgi:hypothetical protein